MTDTEGLPYVLPMNFGYCDGILYIHGSSEGKKAAALQAHPDVCVNFSTDHLLRYQSEQVACSWSMKYRSVLCHGKAVPITDPEEKIQALHVIMAQYTDRKFTYNLPSIREVFIWMIRVERFEGRIFGY
jgi:nitroimidazol reductase NimA-like FMN-containing flavoprotein (pyridoxamine 5'-phosphate oxidase superfamily)